LLLTVAARASLSFRPRLSQTSGLLHRGDVHFLSENASDIFVATKMLRAFLFQKRLAKSVRDLTMAFLFKKCFAKPLLI